MGRHSGNGVLGLEGTKTAGCTDRASPGSRKSGSTQYGNKEENVPFLWSSSLLLGLPHFFLGREH